MTAYSMADFHDVMAEPKDAPADINLEDFGPFNVEAEIAFRKALDNGLPEAAVELLESTGANGHDSASESDYACMGYLLPRGPDAKRKRSRPHG